MTIYSWDTSQGGDWNDPNNWLNMTTNKVDDGVPGAGDTAYASAEFTDVDGVTVENLYTGGEIIGDITVTGIANVGDFTGGVVKVGTDQGGGFDGKSLTAGIIENTAGVTNGFPVLKSGRVTVDLLADAKIEGALVSARSIADGDTGLAVAVTVDSGNLGAAAMTLVGGDGFSMNDGSATISGQATVAGFASVGVDGGQLDFKKSLVLSGSANLSIYAGTTTVAGNLVDSGGTILEAGGALVVMGKTMIGTGGSAGPAAAALPARISKLTLSGGPPQTFSGPVLVGDGASGILIVEAGAVVGGDNDWTVGDLRHGPGNVRVSGQGSQLSGINNLAIGEDGKGTLVVDQHAETGARALTVGDENSGNGRVTIGNGATLSVKDVVDVGFKGVGTLTINGAGTLATDIVGIGVEAGSTGTVSLDRGASLSADDLAIANTPSFAPSAGHGTLTVGAGAMVKITSAVHVGGAIGSGSLTVANGGRLTIGKELEVGLTGRIDLGGGGAITVGNGTAGHAGAVAIFAGGELVLDDKSGGYRAETIIGKGIFEVEASGAAGTGDVLFSGAGGTIELAKRANLANTIFGFGKGDTIDLVGTVANSASFSGGVLTVKHGKTAVATLDFSGSYATGNFSVTFDPADGTTTIGFVAPGNSADFAAFHRSGSGSCECGLQSAGGASAGHLLSDGILQHTVIGFR